MKNNVSVKPEGQPERDRLLLDLNAVAYLTSLSRAARSPRSNAGGDGS